MLGMGAIRDFLARHWRKILGGAIAVAGVVYPPLAPLVPLGTLVIGSDFQLGASIGTPVGAAAKKLAQAHEGLSAADLEALRKAAEGLATGSNAHG
jgi:hypothetical protein